MHNKSATILINKLGAGERQLNAAIRMLLSGEDQLAIHTVAAATYEMLRELKKTTKKRSDAFDPVLRGVFYVARDLARGKIDKIPEEIIDSSVLVHLVEMVKTTIDKGEITSWDDVPAVTIANEGLYWREFNSSSNFLKHADRYQNGLLDIGNVDNHQLLILAATLFLELSHNVTPEMEALDLYLGAPPIGVSESTQLALSKLTPEQRRKRCLRWLRREKRSRAASRKLSVAMIGRR